jgi:lactate permease
VLAAAANTVGGTAGKMLSPQSIAVACAASGLSGREGELLRASLPLSLVLCALAGVATFVAAALAPSVLPGPVVPHAAEGAATGTAEGIALLALSVLLAALVAARGGRGAAASA